MGKTFLDLWEEFKGPPVNVEAIIRGMGLELDKKADLDPDIAGQIEPTPSGTYRISVNKNDHYFRQRFTMAHELGHYLYHRDLIDGGVDDTKAYRSTDIGRFYNARIMPYHETEANKFAAVFLMPQDAIERLLDQGVDDAKELAKRFMVSRSAMRIRLEGLGYSPVPTASCPSTPATPDASALRPRP